MAPFTLVIVGIMGYAMGALSADGKNGMFWSLLAVLIAMIIKIVGYYCAEVLLYGNWVTPLGSIPGNVLQIAIAAVVALPVATVLRRQIHTGRADRPAGQ